MANRVPPISIALSWDDVIRLTTVTKNQDLTVFLPGRLIIVCVKKLVGIFNVIGKKLGYTTS